MLIHFWACILLRTFIKMYLFISTGLYINLNVKIYINVKSYPACPVSSLDLQDSQNIPLTPSQQQLYIERVGFILFLSTRSRPDLSFPVNYYYLSLFMTKAKQHNLNFSCKALKYIWQSRHLTLTFNGQRGIHFSIMVNSSYASHSSRKSYHEFCVPVNSSSSSCFSTSKKSPLLSLSSIEAEYIGMCKASKIIIWLRKLLLELGLPPTSPTIFHEKI